MYTAPCLKKPSFGSDPRSTTSGRFRMMLDALQDTSCTSSSKGWNPTIGNRWRALGQESSRFAFTHASNTGCSMSRNSVRGFTCSMPFIRKRGGLRRPTSNWQGAALAICCGIGGGGGEKHDGGGTLKTKGGRARG